MQERSDPFLNSLLFFELTSVHTYLFLGSCYKLHGFTIVFTRSFNYALHIKLFFSLLYVKSRDLHNRLKSVHDSNKYSLVRSMLHSLCCNMKLRGSLLVIVCCLVVEFYHINRKEYLQLLAADFVRRLFSLTGLALLFLFYPVIGHLTDVYLSKYRGLMISYCFFILAACVIIAFKGLTIATFKSVSIYQPYEIGNIALIIILIVYTIGLGLFQANAIQFGLDQLLEAPTPKLIAFIHWYYWAQNLGSLALFYVVANRSSEVCSLDKPLASLGVYLGCKLPLTSTSGGIFGIHTSKPWRTNIEDHSPMRRWRTLRRSYASYHSSCVCLDTI